MHNLIIIVIIIIITVFEPYGPCSLFC